MNKTIISLGTLLLCAVAMWAKKPLDHDAFDSWQYVRVTSLSNNGRWAAYEVNHQEGDGMLTFRNTATGKCINIPRGYRPRFTANSEWGAALIKPLFADTRKAKIDKKKGFDRPQDSLAIVNLRTGNVLKVPRVINFRLGRDGGDWIVYQSCDTALIKPKALKDSKAGRPLVVRHLPTGNQKVISWTRNYTISRDGLKVAAVLKPHKSDTVANTGMGVIILPDTSFILLDRGKKSYGAPVFSRNSDQLAYTATNDSNDSGTKRYQLYRAQLTLSLPEAEQVTVPVVAHPELRLMRPYSPDSAENARMLQRWAEAQRAATGDSLFINQYSEPEFSADGRRLIIGVAPVIAPDDTTIVDFEQPELDIWRWDAPYTPPQENSNLSDLRSQTFPVVIDITTGAAQIVTTNPLVSIKPSDRWDGNNVLLRDPAENAVSLQWDYTAPETLSIYNLADGSTNTIGKAPTEMSDISPTGRFVVWFADRNYYVYDTKTGKTVNVSANVPYPLWDEDQDVPMMRMPYGDAGWTADDKALLVYDRYDIWSLDPTGVTAPINLTSEAGRKSNLRYRYVRTNNEKRYFDNGDEILLSVFNYADKRNGLATFKIGKPAVPTLRTLQETSFTQIRKALDVPVYAFQEANFSTSPNVYIARDNNFARATRVTDTNPQMSEYNWGKAQLVRWYAYNGDLTEGVLYTPEDLDTTKQYPMLVVFYERNSEELYRHYTMEPSWSWVNYPFYVSRGYVVFVPDVKYAPGIPGESAYNYICSGVEDLVQKYPWIDKNHIGIDGQSWGGYQTAYLVTRTNMFACAGSGAPVANMTSAFGGIRWGSGDSRQGQYEQGQSRIGRNLWEAPQLYIANSPLFYADRVETPLLIMHNDADGAVPWYQGIEMFMGLRRLQKPVWMLQYNGEAHNIRARKNRKDITHRLQQFFDHYLKGDPMPRWMKEGISPLRKGQDLGY